LNQNYRVSIHGWTIGLHYTSTEKAWVVTENDIAGVVTGIVIDMVDMYRVRELGHEAPGTVKCIYARHPCYVARESEGMNSELMFKNSVGELKDSRVDGNFEQSKTPCLTEKCYLSCVGVHVKATDVNAIRWRCCCCCCCRWF